MARRRGQWAAIAVAAAALWPALSVAGDAAAEGLIELLDARVRRELSTRHLPGAALAVVADGRVALLRGYGYADVEASRAVEPKSTAFRVGSVSKVVTWLCLLQLHETGRLNLQADINRHLRGVRIPATYPDPITAAHLITHTAGFEERQLGVFVATQRDLRPLGHWVRDAMPARIRPPGELSGYSNYGAALAGYVVECVAGVPFERYVQERVFGPLGMGHSTFSQSAAEDGDGDLARGYRWGRGGFRRGEEEWVQAAPAGGMRTSAGDMARLMCALLGRRSAVLGPEGLRLMRTRHFAHDPRLPGWTCGLAHRVVAGRTILWHNGATRLFHASLVLLPDLDAGWFIALNGAEGGKALEAIEEAVLDHLAPAEALAAPSLPGGSAARARLCAGEYEPSRSNRTTLEKFGRPFSPVRVRATRSGELLLCSGGTARRFRETAPFVFERVDGRDRLVFRRREGRPLELYGSSSPSAAGGKLRWWEGSSLHLSLLALCLAAFLSLFPRRLWALLQTPREPPGTGGRGVEWALAPASGLNVVFLLGLALVLLRTVWHPYGYPAYWRPLSFVPWVTSALGMAAVGLAAHDWATRRGSLLQRLHHSLVALASVLFGLLAWYWNMMA